MGEIAMLLVFSATSFFGSMWAQLAAPPVPSSPLVECSWTLGGGMRGGHDIITIARSGDVAVISTSHADQHDSEPEEATYEAPLETLDEIKAIFAREGMNAWPKLPMREERLLDADTWSMSFMFDGPGRYSNRHFRFTQEQTLPLKGYEAVREIRDIMRGSAARNSKSNAECGIEKLKTMRVLDLGLGLDLNSELRIPNSELKYSAELKSKKTMLHRCERGRRS